MINEIHQVFNFSYSRIAYRIGVSPSSIQKLIKDPQRTPRDATFFNLACYYYKLFYSIDTLPTSKKYVEDKKDETLCDTVIELLERGYLDDLDELNKPQEGNKKDPRATAKRKGFLGKESKLVGMFSRSGIVPANFAHFQLTP
jgi:hypothetical protein